MLLDPFEKQLDLPAHAVELGDSERRQCEVVGQKDQPFAGLRIFDPDPSQGCLEALARIKAGERDSLIADQPCLSTAREYRRLALRLVLARMTKKLPAS